MSWRAALRRLYTFGGVAGVSLVGNRREIDELRTLGLATNRFEPVRKIEQLRRAMPREYICRITPLGRDVFEGRVQRVCARPGGGHWEATWLRALPRPEEICT